MERVDFQLTQPDVFGDPDAVKKIQRERARLLSTIETTDQLEALLDDGQTFLELSREGEQVDDDLKSTLSQLESKAETLELSTLLTGEHDGSDAIVEVHPGAGGTESQDWADMLFRMYRRWARVVGFQGRGARGPSR